VQPPWVIAPIFSLIISVTGDVRLERLGEELAPDSSVWPTYVATAGAHDKDMVDGWNKSLDVLLIFVRHFMVCDCDLLMLILGMRRQVCSPPL
jgi:hypothetical protein